MHKKMRSEKKNRRGRHRKGVIKNQKVWKKFKGHGEREGDL